MGAPGTEEEAWRGRSYPASWQASPPAQTLQPIGGACLLGLLATTNALTKDGLLVVQSWFCPPYRHLAYHLAVVLGSAASPAS